MISVAIMINGNPIMARSATNITPKKNYKKGMQVYKCDDGTLINHHYDKGAVELAKKLLDTIKPLIK